MKSCTVDQVLAWDPCDSYTRERLTTIFAGRESLTAREIAALTDVPWRDRLWTLRHNYWRDDRDASRARRCAACACRRPASRTRPSGRRR